MTMTRDFMFCTPGTAISQVLAQYVDRNAQDRWFLVTERAGQHYVCTFASLLPYLTGWTDHIEHRPGECEICSGPGPRPWGGTEELVRQALADEGICSRPVSSLPMAKLPVRDIERLDPPADKQDPETMSWLHWVTAPARGVLQDGVLCAVHYDQMRDEPGGMPPF